MTSISSERLLAIACAAGAGWAFGRAVAVLGGALWLPGALLVVGAMVGVHASRDMPNRE